MVRFERLIERQWIRARHIAGPYIFVRSLEVTMVFKTRRSHRPSTRRATARAAAPAGSSTVADTHAVLLGRFSDAISLLTVVHEALAAKELRGVGDHEVALRIGLDGLRVVYDEFDAASGGHDASLRSG